MSARPDTQCAEERHDEARRGKERSHSMGARGGAICAERGALDEPQRAPPQIRLHITKETFVL